MRRIRYQEIADELRARAKAMPPGSLLPSEADMSAIETDGGAMSGVMDMAMDEVLTPVARKKAIDWAIITTLRAYVSVLPVTVQKSGS